MPSFLDCRLGLAPDPAVVQLIHDLGVVRVYPAYAQSDAQHEESQHEGWFCVELHIDPPARKQEQERGDDQGETPCTQHYDLIQRLGLELVSSYAFHGLSSFPAVPAPRVQGRVSNSYMISLAHKSLHSFDDRYSK